jgi:hypothetical protein
MATIGIISKTGILQNFISVSWMATKLLKINTKNYIFSSTYVFMVSCYKCRSCDLTNLERGSYTDKVVLCQKAEENDGSGPLLAGAAGAVIVSDVPDVAFALPLPGLTVTRDEFDQIMAYVNSTR